MAFFTMDDKEKEKREKRTLQKRFGEHLIALRKSMDLTPAALARRCYMKDQILQDWKQDDPIHPCLY